jgi:hypothetical protein
MLTVTISGEVQEKYSSSKSLHNSRHILEPKSDLFFDAATGPYSLAIQILTSNEFPEHKNPTGFYRSWTRQTPDPGDARKDSSLLVVLPLDAAL